MRDSSLAQLFISLGANQYKKNKNNISPHEIYNASRSKPYDYSFWSCQSNFDYKEGNNTSYQARIYQQQQSKIDKGSIFFEKEISYGDIYNFLVKGGNLQEAKSKTYHNLLHNAAFRGNIAECKILLKYGGINLSKMKNINGSIPLHLACGTGHKDIAKLLIQK